MTKILFDIDNNRLDGLDSVLAAKGWSRAEAIRYAIDMLIAQESEKEKLSKKAFGLWKDRKIDGVEYQKKMREEWE